MNHNESNDQGQDSDAGQQSGQPSNAQDLGQRKIQLSWATLEDAFENNSPEIHSYLNIDSGEVVRIVDGLADVSMHERIASDPNYLRVEPVSSREQYRWMERFIAQSEPTELRDRLAQSIDGKGAFRRFKDVLVNFPAERERWFAFRSERLKGAMETWLAAHSLEASPPSEWPIAQPVELSEEERANRNQKPRFIDLTRNRLHEWIDELNPRDIESASAFVEFLRDRRANLRSRLRVTESSEGVELSGERSSGEKVTASSDLSGETPIRSQSALNAVLGNRSANPSESEAKGRTGSDSQD